MDFKTFLDNLNEEITCPICQETYGQPKLLPCVHTVCVDCLNTMAQSAIRGNRTAILCPLCTSNIQIPQPDGNFNSLPNNIYINRFKDIVAVREDGSQNVTCGNCDEKAKEASYCFDCCKFWCKKCEAVHKIVKELKGHRVLALGDFHDDDLEAMLQRPAFCQKRDHENEFLKYYCNDCRDCICQMCVIVEHKTHRVKPMQEVARAYQADIAEEVTKAKGKLQEYNSGREKVQERKTLEQNNLETVTTDIHNTLEMVTAALRRHERELVAEIEELAATSLDHLDTQHSNITSHIHRMQQAIDFAERLVQRKCTLEILTTKASLDQRFDRLNELNVKIKPDVAVEGSFIPSEAVAALKLGRLQKTVDPRKSTVDHRIWFGSNIFKGNKVTFSLTTRNQFGQLCYNPRLTISVKVTPRQHGHVIAPPVHVKDKLNGEYSISFTPQETGEHEVSALVGESEFDGSPFVFQAKSAEFVPVKVIGKEGQGNGEFYGPGCVAVNVELNEIAVTDLGNCRIQIFNRKSYTFLRQFGQKGSSQGMFQVPIGIVYDNQNNIIVSDTANNTVSVFTKDGTFLRNLATEGNQAGQVTDPAALSITDEGNIIVTDSGNKRIQVFSPDGQLVLKFGDTSNEKLQFPMACVYHRDHYIVTDCVSQCVKLYDSSGQYVRKFGAPEDSKAAAFGPHGITSTSCGNIIVSDCSNHLLLMFRLDGSVIATVGTQGTGLGQFNWPTDVSILSDGTVIVCESRNNWLQVLKHP